VEWLKVKTFEFKPQYQRKKTKKKLVLDFSDVAMCPRIVT
jgi:hypothetical protein